MVDPIEGEELDPDNPPVYGWRDAPVSGERVDLHEGPIIAGDPVGARAEVTETGFRAYDSTGAETVRIDGADNLLTGNFRTANSGARVAIYREGDTGFADGVGIEFLGTEPQGADPTGPNIYAPGVAARGSLRLESGSTGFDPGWDGSPSSYMDMQTDALEVGYGVQGTEGSASFLKATQQAVEITSETVRVNTQKIGPGEWVTATKTAAWTGAGAGALEYMIQNGMVHFAGEISRASTTAAGWHQMTSVLPSSIIPTRKQIREAPTTAGVKILLQVSPTGSSAGQVEVFFSETLPADTTVHLSALSYPVG